MKYIFLVLMSVFTLAESMQTRAEKEKWEFKFDESQVGKYATGLKKVLGVYKKGFTFVELKDVDVDLPKKWDWRENGLKVTVRNQGNCGSCWSFSLVAVAQHALMLKGKNPPPGLLSEQYMVDCATDMYGCNGGMPDAARWLVAPKGAPLLSDYPYTARDGRCEMANKTVAGSILEWHYVGESDRVPTIEEIKKAIYLYGPVSVTVSANSAFSAYTSGIYNACSQGQTNHMVVLTGWDDDTKTWVLQNSWGTSWGEGGFMRIKWTDSQGRLCNRVGEDTVYVKVDEKPVPPTPKEFQMTTESGTIVYKMNVNAKYTIEEAKKVIQLFLNKLEKK